MDQSADDTADAAADELDDETWDRNYHHDPLVRELRRLKQAPDSQRRGYDFENFVGSLFRQCHFSVIPGPGTARPRQTDLLARRGGETYLIETKWRKTKATINDIDSLFTRLDATPRDVTGLLVSFRGFTDEVIARVEQRSDRPVLLVSGEELEALVEWDRDLLQLLARKKTALLTHRQAQVGVAGSSRSKRPKDSLPIASADFVLPDGTRSKYLAGHGSFGQFTFAQQIPDIDWNPGEGHGVTLDLALPVYDERGILSLVDHLAGKGWATESAAWSIQQTETNWHGMGPNAFAHALSGWRERYKGIATHHSEEFCYFDTCDGGFYCLTANLSAGRERSASYTMLSFQLAGTPLDTDALKELSTAFDVSCPAYFRSMDRPSVVRKWNLRKPLNVPLEPVAFIAEHDNAYGDKRDWARGIVAKNPFYEPRSRLVERQPEWLSPHVFESETLICSLRSWHLLSEPKTRYELWGYESVRAGYGTVVRPIAEWPTDRELPETEDLAPPRKKLAPP